MKYSTTAEGKEVETGKKSLTKIAYLKNYETFDALRQCSQTSMVATLSFSKTSCRCWVKLFYDDALRDVLLRALRLNALFDERIRVLSFLSSLASSPSSCQGDSVIWTTLL